MGVLTFIAFAFGRFQGGFVPWFLFYVSFILLLYVALVAFFALRNPEVERVLSASTATAGESLKVSIRYRIPAVIPPAWIWIRDVGDPKALTQEGFTTLVPGFSREGVLEYGLYNLPRGRHRFHSIEVRSGDLFGLVEKRWNFSRANEILVYPRTREIRSWHTVNDRNTGRSFATHRIGEDVTSVVGVRDYTDRDALSRIHWKASARGQGLKAKEFEHRITNDFMFVLDCHAAHFSGEGDPLFERAVSLTASLARFAVQRRFSAGVIAWGNRRLHLPPGRTPDHLSHLFEPLAVIQPQGQKRIADVLLNESVYLPQGTTVVLVTPRLGEAEGNAISQLVLRKIKVEVFRVVGDGPLPGGETGVPGFLDSLGVRVYPVRNDAFEHLTGGGADYGSGSA
ncbi:uncharacterized protein (DUF58 family) [Melghirimyces profundicolus]|uniref:Uncharacterized protein (DUF58 family) n=2 Tax=Melghirimyces profundicolus TaxID=1242148 RepID=A0A2T6AZX2_9BACL|nr:uncharacterized protein (DUF58 family) [Melghirimyces profundicolus]